MSTYLSDLFWTARRARCAFALAACCSIAAACGGGQANAPPAASAEPAPELAHEAPAPSPAPASAVTQDTADNTPGSAPDNTSTSPTTEQPANLAADVEITPQERQRVKTEQCAALLKRMQDGESVSVLVQTQRGELPPEQRTKAGQAACERVTKRLPASVRATASIGCDIGMISLSADAARTKKLCADRDVTMVGENQPAFPQSP